MSIRVLLVLPFFILLHNVFGGSQLQFDHYSTDQGLSNSRINSIAEDKYGFKWLGTRSGLNRYDGYQFDVYKRSADEQSISGDDVSVVYPSKRGFLWVGTWYSGLNKFDVDFFKAIRFPNEQHDYANTIKTLFESSDTTLYVGTFGAGLYRFNEHEGFVKIPVDSSACGFEVIDQIVEFDNKIWVSSITGGIGVLEKGTLHRVDWNHPCGQRLDFSTIAVVSVHEMLVADLTGKVYSYHTQDQSLSEPILDLQGVNMWKMVYHDGLLFLSTDSGFFVYHRHNERLDKYLHKEGNNRSISGNRTSDFIIDNRNILWLGTWESGVNVANPITNAFASLPTIEDGMSNRVGNITFSNDSIVWCSSTLGLIQFNKKTGEKINYARDTLGDANYGKYFVTYLNGKIIVDKASEIFSIDLMSGDIVEGFLGISLPSLDYRDCFVDRDQNIWLSSAQNVILKVDLEAQRFDQVQVGKKIPVGNNGYFALAQDQYGKVWLGAKNGLFYYDDYNMSFVQDDFIQNKGIRSMVIDHYGELWMGTEHGLVAYNPKIQKTKVYDKSAGIADNVIYGVIAANQQIWMSTNNGLSCIHLKDSSISNFTKSDGLLSAEFGYGAYAKNGNDLYFGSNYGVNYFNPDYIMTDPRLPELYITGFKVFNKSIYDIEHHADLPPTSLLNKISLSPFEKTFSISFVGLNYTKPKEQKYAYRLIGYDDEWNYVDASKREAIYANLGPGHYSFHVKAANSNGLWNHKSKVLEIKIRPFVWQTWWFKTIAAIVLLGGFYFYYRQRLLRIKSRNKELEKIVNDRTAELKLKGDELVEKNQQLGTRNKSLEDSINYGLRIQQSMLPDYELLHEGVKDIAVFFRPKERVSGDFYWSYTISDTLKVIAVVDCTGHGVPGAFMSMIGMKALNFIVGEKGVTDPAQVLQMMDEQVYLALKQEETRNADGMDASVICIDTSGEKIKVLFAGAKRPLLKVSKDGVEKIKADRLSIAGGRLKTKAFTSHTLTCEKDDRLFMFTDGVPDQADVNRVKYSSRRLATFLSQEPSDMKELMKKLGRDIDAFSTDADQRDDMTVLGVWL